jgi:glycosyltransferase involved in cell wall biosynthesis
MLISVIVPVYNVEKYLKKCLDSILQQTYKELEIIMVDDGSTDSSSEICDNYAKQYTNFYVIHKKNAGLGLARNTGLKYVTGKYVTFLDSDDYLTPTCIENLYKNISQNHVDVCKGGFKKVTDDGKIISVTKYDYRLFKGESARLELLPRMIGSSPFQHDSIEMCVCGVIYKAEIIKNYNLCFPSEREYISEDLVFNIDYMQYADGACTIAETGYNYRVNNTSLTRSYRSDRFEASRYFYLEMVKKCKKLGYDQMTILRLHRMFFIYLKMSIVQETPKISSKTRKENIQNIKKICNDTVVRQAIKKYPIKELGFKQKFFLNMIKFKTVILLYVIARWGKM